MRDTAGEIGTNSWVTYSRRPLHMDEQRQNDLLEPTYCSSVPIQNVALKTCRKQWTIEKGREKGSGISVLMAWHDDDLLNFYCPISAVNNEIFLVDDIYIYIYIYIYIGLVILAIWKFAKEFLWVKKFKKNHQHQSSSTMSVWSHIWVNSKLIRKTGEEVSGIGGVAAIWEPKILAAYLQLVLKDIFIACLLSNVLAMSNLWQGLSLSSSLMSHERIYQL